MTKSEADELFMQAMSAISAAGESPVNYAASYIRGVMTADGSREYIHEWEDGVMRCRLTDEQIH